MSVIMIKDYVQRSLLYSSAALSKAFSELVGSPVLYKGLTVHEVLDKKPSLACK